MKQDLKNPNQRLFAFQNQAALTNHHVAKQTSQVTTLAEVVAMNEEKGGREHCYAKCSHLQMRTMTRKKKSHLLNPLRQRSVIHHRRVVVIEEFAGAVVVVPERERERGERE